LNRFLNIYVIYTCIKQSLQNKVYRSSIFNLSGLMTLEEYLEFLQVHYIQTSEVIGNFEKITTIRGLGKNKSYKRINKHKRKKTRIHKKNHPIIK
jgi:hypothetical protein